MPLHYPLFTDPVPDILAKLGTFLPGYHLAEDLTGWTKGNTWVTVQPTGGSFPNANRIASVRLDINAYGPTKPNTQTIALQAIQAFYKLKNEKLTSGIVITGIECSYPADISDPINNNPRYVFDVTLNYRTP